MATYLERLFLPYQPSERGDIPVIRGVRVTTGKWVVPQSFEFIFDITVLHLHATDGSEITTSTVNSITATLSPVEQDLAQIDLSATLSLNDPLMTALGAHAVVRFAASVVIPDTVSIDTALSPFDARIEGGVLESNLTDPFDVTNVVYGTSTSHVAWNPVTRTFVIDALIQYIATNAVVSPLPPLYLNFRRQLIPLRPVS